MNDFGTKLPFVKNPYFATVQAYNRNWTQDIVIDLGLHVLETGNTPFQEEGGFILLPIYFLDSKYALFQRSLEHGHVPWSRSSSAQGHNNPYSEFDDSKFLQAWVQAVPLPAERPSPVTEAVIVRPPTMPMMMVNYAQKLEAARHAQEPMKIHDERPNNEPLRKMS